MVYLGDLATSSPTIISTTNLDIQNTTLSFTLLAIYVLKQIKGLSELIVGDLVAKSPYERYSSMEARGLPGRARLRGPGAADGPASACTASSARWPSLPAFSSVVKALQVYPRVLYLLILDPMQSSYFIPLVPTGPLCQHSQERTWVKGDELRFSTEV